MTASQSSPLKQFPKISQNDQQSRLRNAPDFVEVGEAGIAVAWIMLCGVSVVFNSLDDVLGLMSYECSSENGQVLLGFQSTEAFGCLHHAVRRSSATLSRRFAIASRRPSRGWRDIGIRKTGSNRSF
jgi:hypothetical protein